MADGGSGRACGRSSALASQTDQEPPQSRGLFRYRPRESTNELSTHSRGSHDQNRVGTPENRTASGRWWIPHQRRLAPVPTRRSCSDRRGWEIDPTSAGQRHRDHRRDRDRGDRRLPARRRRRRSCRMRMLREPSFQVRPNGREKRRAFVTLRVTTARPARKLPSGSASVSPRSAIPRRRPRLQVCHDDDRPPRRLSLRRRVTARFGECLPGARPREGDRGTSWGCFFL